MSKYVLLKTILKNDDIYNPIFEFKIRNIKTLEYREISENEFNKLLKDKKIVNCGNTIE